MNARPLTKLILLLTSICLVLLPSARAVDPPPDGGYANGNTAEGEDALFSLTTGLENTALGHDALFNVSTGIFNTATGDDALFATTTGYNNTAIGWHAMENNTTGGTNTAIGCDALESNSIGTNNIAAGFRAGWLTDGSNNIAIGNAGVSGESNRIRIGTRQNHKSTYIAGIFGVTVPTGVGVLIDNSGHLGTVTSSARFKEAIKPMDKASEAILGLQPVTFHYKHELDPDEIEQFGLVAEQVEKVDPALVARDDQGKPYTVRYEAVNAMLLNEFLKEHRKVEEQARQNAEQDRKAQEEEQTIGELRSQIVDQQEQIALLTSQMHEVREQLQASRPQPNLSVAQVKPSE